MESRRGRASARPGRGGITIATLEELRPNAAVRGILPDELVTVVNTQWFGDSAIELTYKNATGARLRGTSRSMLAV
jgi:hypothetical protein